MKCPECGSGMIIRWVQTLEGGEDRERCTRESCGYEQRRVVPEDVPNGLGYDDEDDW